jgi:hypothetical protein
VSPTLNTRLSLQNQAASSAGQLLVAELAVQDICGDRSFVGAFVDMADLSFPAGKQERKRLSWRIHHSSRGRSRRFSSWSLFFLFSFFFSANDFQI